MCLLHVKLGCLRANALGRAGVKLEVALIVRGKAIVVLYSEVVDAPNEVSVEVSQP